MLTVHLNIKAGPEITLKAEGEDSEGKLLSLIETILLTYGVTQSQACIKSPIEGRDQTNKRTNGYFFHTEEPPTTNPENQESPFSDFCKSHDPRSDRGRVLVAAEGARLFLGFDCISTETLTPLFNALGWPLPINFLTTIRNASRNNCGWIERVRGKQGYYTVTEKGRSTLVQEL
jgi:hypothetical protein